jgi:hypothetical protein
METEGHFRVYKCPPPVPVLSQINTVHAPHPAFWRFILMLSSHLSLGLRSGLFPSSFFYHNPLCTPALSRKCFMLLPSHSSRFDHPNNIGPEVKKIRGKSGTSFQQLDLFASSSEESGRRPIWAHWKHLTYGVQRVRVAVASLKITWT